MKMLFIIYDVEFDEDVMETLTTCSIKGYTKWDRVLGKGDKSNPKLDDAVWPGYNCSVAVAVEDCIEDETIKALTGLSDRLGGKGFKAFELPILRVI
ncbi:MAG: transcriptional regulator [Thermodesulfobacteriota bacterium]|nr:transcriptional regulator [Thermodesulfobacteriota bacterium]